MYSDIISILSKAASDSFDASKPKRKKGATGWNNHVRNVHREARDKFKTWVLYGKPREGLVWEEMRESHKIFKSRLEWYRNNNDKIKMDILVSHHSKYDFRNFWSCTNNLITKPGLPVSVNGLCEVYSGII